MYTLKLRSTYDHEANIGETNALPSLTAPNQSLNIAELVERFTISSSWNPRFPIPDQFDNEQTLDLPELAKLDKIERRDFALQNKVKIAELQNDLVEGQKAEKAKMVTQKEEPKNVTNPKEDSNKSN